MTGDRVSDGLAELQARFAHRATQAALDPEDYDGDDPFLTGVRGAGVDVMRQARWSAIVPQRFHRAQLSDMEDAAAPDWQPAAAAQLREWAQHPAGRNVVILGPVGTGKTHAAVAAARVRHEQGGDVRFLPVVEMLDMLRPGGPEGALYDLADVGTLVLDDVGSERPTEWTAERMYALINRRWMEERPIIATSNLPASRRVAPDGYDGATLDEAIGLRTFSRLVGNGAVVLKLTGDDRRRARRKDPTK